MTKPMPLSQFIALARQLPPSKQDELIELGKELLAEQRHRDQQDSEGRAA